MSKDYQNIARRFRPQSFQDILGQDTIVETLKNSILHHKTAPAYLFSGAKGTGKTSTARVYAKALLCETPSPTADPCNKCTFCQEVVAGNSLNVIEIDGASNRGIEDIRKINETVAYAPQKGKFKIYIIDEVHMLTKEAFNALLKTLEEPPAFVKFIFATTEPHKVLATILSRCQKFTFSRLQSEVITQKLQKEASELNLELCPQASEILVKASEGSLRDAEALLDQMASFTSGKITKQKVQEALGLPDTSFLQQLEQAFAGPDYPLIFEIAHELFKQGKDYNLVLDCLLEYFQTLLMHKLNVPQPPVNKDLYGSSTESYSCEQCQQVIELIFDCKQKLQQFQFGRSYFEHTLCKIATFLHTLPIEKVIESLSHSENSINTTSSTLSNSTTKPALSSKTPIKLCTPTQSTTGLVKQTPSEPSVNKKKSEDLTLSSKENRRLDTLLQFSAVELEAIVEKNKISLANTN